MRPQREDIVQAISDNENVKQNDKNEDEEDNVFFTIGDSSCRPISHHSHAQKSTLSSMVASSSSLTCESISVTSPKEVELSKLHRHHSEGARDTTLTTLNGGSIGNLDLGGSDGDLEVRSDPASPPLRAGVPGWSSAPPQRTVSTPSGMNKENRQNRIKDEESGNHTQGIHQVGILFTSNAYMSCLKLHVSFDRLFCLRIGNR